MIKIKKVEVEFEPFIIEVRDTKNEDIIDGDRMESIDDVKVFMDSYKDKYQPDEIEFIRKPIKKNGERISNHSI